MTELDFTKYVREFKKGDLSSFDEFYEEVKQKVFYNIYALTRNYEVSEDLLQDTFVKFLKNVNEIDEDESVLGYLMVVSRNLTLDYFKKYNRVRNIEDDIDHPSTYDEDEIDKNLILDKVKEILKPKEFEIFTLHVLNDMTFEEISKLKGRPLGTITRAYNNAIKKLKGGLTL